MKLLDVLESEFDDDSPFEDKNYYPLSPIQRKLKSIKYIFDKLYGQFNDSKTTDWINLGKPNGIRPHQYSKQTEKFLDKLVKNKHLWAQDADCALQYSTSVINNKFTEGEKIIATDFAYKNAYETFWDCTI